MQQMESNHGIGFDDEHEHDPDNSVKNVKIEFTNKDKGIKLIRENRQVENYKLK